MLLYFPSWSLWKWILLSQVCTQREGNKSLSLGEDISKYTFFRILLWRRFLSSLSIVYSIIYLYRYELRIFILFFGSKFNAIAILLVKLFKLWPLGTPVFFFFFPVFFFHALPLPPLLLCSISLFFGTVWCSRLILWHISYCFSGERWLI